MWFSFPGMHSISSLRYTQYTQSLAGEGEWVIVRRHYVRKACLYVPSLREFLSCLYSYVCPDYGGRFNTLYWKGFLYSEWMLENYHQLVLHSQVFVIRQYFRILCYIRFNRSQIRVREGSEKIGKGSIKLLRPCLLTIKMKPERIVHFRWLHQLG